MVMNEYALIKIAILILAIAIPIGCFVSFKENRKDILLGLFSLGLSLVVAEIFLGSFYPQIMQHDDMFQRDAHLGWTFVSNHKGSIFYPGEANHYIHTNSLGFRDDEPPTDVQSQNKIMVLGDSFVTNVAVTDENVFTEIMEQTLKNTTVFNMGVNGYGQIQEYLTLQKWWDTIQPDLVITIIYVRNDFSDNLGGFWFYPRPVAHLNDDGVTVAIEPVPAVKEKDMQQQPVWQFYRKSHIYALFDRSLKIIIDSARKKLEGIKSNERAPHKRTKHTPPELYLCLLKPTEETLRMVKTLEALLLKIAGFAGERKVPILFAVAPSIFQVEDDMWAQIIKDEENPLDYARNLPAERLMRFAKSNNLAMLDLSPTLTRAAKMGEKVYNRKEQHWNKAGNRIVAQALLEFIEMQQLIPNIK